MRNAKDEFITHVNRREVLCCEIHVSSRDVELTTGWVKSELEMFLKNIDIEYDAGYGGQELYGTIWYKDGTWSTRGEYDGSEWWEYHSVPTIPDHLNRIDKVRDEKLNKLIDE